MTLQATVRPLADRTQILVTEEGQDCLRAVLPTRPLHPRALLTLFEGLTLWRAMPLDAVLVVDERSGRSPVDTLFDGALWPDELAQVRFDIRQSRRGRRLRGPGDFRALYRLHGACR